MATQIRRRSEDAFFKAPRTFPARFPNGMPVGKRTIKRQEQNRILNERLKHIKRQCEVQIPGVCVRNILLTWMHSKKSRFILTDKDWQEAARACQPCHLYGESKGHKFMRELVLCVIKKREKQTLPNG